MRTTARLALAGAILLATSAALAAGRTLTAAEADAYVRLADAKALSEARASGPGGPEKRARAAADWRKALADAGWTEARWSAAESIFDDASGYLQALTDAPEEAKGWWDGYEPVDPATIALVKARREAVAGASRRAEQALREEREAGLLGRLATPGDLQGTWKLDRAASKAHLSAALRFDGAQADQVLAAQGEQTLIFTGDQVESRQVRGGKAETWKGAWRLEGRQVHFKIGKREEKLGVGVKGPTELVFSAFGVPSGVYVKQ
jgi:hypothetical protein